MTPSLMSQDVCCELANKRAPELLNSSTKIYAKLKHNKLNMLYLYHHISTKFKSLGVACNRLCVDSASYFQDQE